VPITEAALAAALADLNAAVPVTSRKMFGGAGFYADGVFFAILDDDRLFFKVNPTTATVYDELGMEPWYIHGDPKPKAYREVPADWRRDPERLRAAIAESVEVAQAGTTKKSRRR
jgi:DNA transformation protein